MCLIYNVTDEAALNRSHRYHYLSFSREREIHELPTKKMTKNQKMHERKMKTPTTRSNENRVND